MKGAASFSLLGSLKQGQAAGCLQSCCRVHPVSRGLAQMNLEAVGRSLVPACKLLPVQDQACRAGKQACRKLPQSDISVTP